jgi:hypothetical protein
VRLVGALGFLTIDLVGPATDMFFETSRSNREKAKKLRKLDETKKLYGLAREVAAEWARGDSSPHRGQKITVAAIVREVGRRMFDSDDATAWPVTERALYDRLRQYVKTLKRPRR